MTTFDPTNPDTWSLALTDVQIAAIYQRAVGGIRQACKRGRFVPAPMDGKPRRWRKADVLRHLESGRGAASLRRAG